jgi:hypothetical protein
VRESRGSTKPKGAVKVKAFAGASRWDAVPPGRPHHRPVLIATSMGRSKSVHVGTRKAVSYT